MQPFYFFHEFVWLKQIFRHIFSSDVTKKGKKKNIKQRPYMCFNMSVYMCVCYSLMSR